MSRLVRASELIGMPLITLDTADVVGEVRDVLTDAQAVAVAAFTVRGRGLLSPALVGVLPIDRVHAIGREALIIPAAEAVDEPDGRVPPTEQPEVVGRQVVTASGDELGTVTDLVLDIEEAAAQVVGFEIERADGQRLLTPLNGMPLLEQDPLVIAQDATSATYGLAGLRRLLDRAAEPRPGAPA